MKRFSPTLLKSPTLSICLLTALAYGYLSFAYPKGNVLSWDVFGYYLYLPQTFIHHDPGIHDTGPIEHILETYHNSATFYQAPLAKSGNHIIRYPAGLAIMYAPFFFIAHLCVRWTDYPADGFSAPYQLSFSIGYFIYALLAIFLLRKVLLRFFDEKTSSIALLLLFWGTNFYSTAIEGVGMPHLYLFVLFAVVMLLTDNWYKLPKRSTALLLGLTIGLMTISRPTEILVCIIPLCYGLSSIKSIPDRIKFFLVQHRVHLIITSLGVALMASIQLLFWKKYTGHFIYYSYQNPGEGLDFNNPHLLEFLFSFRKGWFIYTPIMLLAFIGFIELYRRRSNWFYPALFFVVLNIYVLSSWSCWWYAGSFSQRPVVDSYPLMTILIAGLVNQMLRKTKLIQYTVLLFLTGFSFLNLFQSWQLNHTILDAYRMTWPYYKAIFGKTKLPAGADTLLLLNRSFDGSEVFNDTTGYTGKWIIDKTYEKEIKLDQTNCFSPACEVPYKDITDKDHAWLKIYCDVKLLDSISKVMPTVVRSFINYKGYDYKYSLANIHPADSNYINKWMQTSSIYLTPEVRSIHDKLRISLWVKGSGKMLLKRVRVRAYEPFK